MKNHPELAFCVHPDLQSFKLDPAHPYSLKGFFLPYGEPNFVTTIEEAVACVLDVCHSVAILIQLGIVHHDISLDNILEKGGKYFLVDFDDAAFIGSNGVCSALDIRRLSPEKHCPKTYTEHGHEVDIWSIGRILTLFRVTSGGNGLVTLGKAVQHQYETIPIAEVIVLVRQLL